MKGETSEIRQDPVGKDWVIIATGRSKKPDDFKKEKKPKSDLDKSSCPFCGPSDVFESPENENKLIKKFYLKDQDDWWVSVIENKYPAVEGNKCGIIVERGPYKVQAGAGYHEVVITRDHDRSIGQMSQEEVEKLLEAYQDRYEALRKIDCADYILIFHNHGEGAGASVEHPHSQIIAIPVIPADVERSLEGSRRHHESPEDGCIYCKMINWEKKEGKRIIFENESMMVLAPYVPRASFELRIYPKKHNPYFESINREERADLAEALRVALGKLYTGLSNPDYNFFIHTAPAHERQMYSFYHWHLEIFPKTATMAGFELGTGIEISAVDPDEAAEHLINSTLPQDIK